MILEPLRWAASLNNSNTPLPTGVAEGEFCRQRCAYQTRTDHDDIVMFTHTEPSCQRAREPAVPMVCAANCALIGGKRSNPKSPKCRAAVWGARVDRKSTRLNSSHVAISYAVFCLKKKIEKKKL